MYINWAPPCQSCLCGISQNRCKTLPLLWFYDQGAHGQLVLLLLCKHGSQRVGIPHFLTFLTPCIRLLSYLARHLSSQCSLASCAHSSLARWLFRFDFFRLLEEQGLRLHTLPWWHPSKSQPSFANRSWLIRKMLSWVDMTGVFAPYWGDVKLINPRGPE